MSSQACATPGNAGCGDRSVRRCRALSGVGASRVAADCTGPDRPIDAVRLESGACFRHGGGSRPGRERRGCRAKGGVGASLSHTNVGLGDRTRPGVGLPSSRSRPSRRTPVSTTIRIQVQGMPCGVSRPNGSIPPSWKKRCCPKAPINLSCWRLRRLLDRVSTTSGYETRFRTQSRLRCV